MRVCIFQLSILALLFVVFTPRVFFRLPVSNRWLLVAHAVSFFLVSYIVFTMMKYTSRLGFQNETVIEKKDTDYLPYNLGHNSKNTNIGSLLFADFENTPQLPPTEAPVTTDFSLSTLSDELKSILELGAEPGILTPTQAIEQPVEQQPVEQSVEQPAE